MKPKKIIDFILCGLLAVSAAGAAETAIPIDGKDKGRTFDGIGALQHAGDGEDPENNEVKESGI